MHGQLQKAVVPPPLVVVRTNPAVFRHEGLITGSRLAQSHTKTMRMTHLANLSMRPCMRMHLACAACAAAPMHPCADSHAASPLLLPPASMPLLQIAVIVKVLRSIINSQGCFVVGGAKVSVGRWGAMHTLGY